MSLAQRIIATLYFLLFVCIGIYFVPAGLKLALLHLLVVGSMAGITFVAAKGWGV
ncbi:MAG: hypothetical protein ABSF97_21335 [Candidatus Sulfotelmatobacter sp.]|jgi:hypothetical protein